VAEFYAASGSLLQKVRRLRNGVIHQGTSNGPIFVVEKGFAIGREQPLFKTFPEIWLKEHAYNENVYSLRPLIAHVAVNALHTCTLAAHALAKSLAFPPEVAPGYRVFIRAPHSSALLKAQAVLEGANPWWEP
jgi:hypothetical protein